VAIIALTETTGPLSPCTPPLPGAPVASTTAADSTPIPTPFDSESIVVSIGGFALLLALIAALIIRRLKAKRTGGRLIILVVLSIAFAAFAAAWVWQLRTSYIGGGCVIIFNAAPFPDEQAFTLAPLFTLLVCALAGIWIAAAGVTALRRGVASE